MNPPPKSQPCVPRSCLCTTSPFPTQNQANPGLGAAARSLHISGALFRGSFAALFFTIYPESRATPAGIHTTSTSTGVSATASCSTKGTVEQPRTSFGCCCC